MHGYMANVLHAVLLLSPLLNQAFILFIALRKPSLMGIIHSSLILVKKQSHERLCNYHELYTQKVRINSISLEITKPQEMEERKTHL